MRTLDAALVLGALALALGATATTPPNVAKALEAQRALAAERPDDPQVLNDLGNLLALAGDLAGAEGAYQRALALAPDLVSTRYNAGLLAQQRGASDEALADFREVVTRDPHHAWAHYQIGAILERRGDRAGAVDAYAKAFLEDPELAFSEVNPQIIDSGLVLQALQKSERMMPPAREAPRTYEDPSRMSSLLLQLPPPSAAATQEAPAASGSEGSPSATGGPGGAAATPAPGATESGGEAAAGGGRQVRVLRPRDLDTGSSVGQATPPDAGSAAPNRTGGSRRRYVPGGTSRTPYLPGRGRDQGSGSGTVLQGGFAPAVESTSQLEIRLLPEAAPAALHGR